MQTLEDYGNQLAIEFGKDSASPAVRTKISEGVNALRQAFPGVSDEEIIAQHGDIIRQHFSQPEAAPETAPASPAPTTPAPATAPAPTSLVQPSETVQKYKAAQEKFNQDFSADKEAALRDTASMKSKFAQAGAMLGRSAEIAAGPQYAASLQQMDKDIQAGINAPIADWQTRKNAELGRLQELIKAGQIEGQDVKDQLSRLGLEQALQERKDKAAITAAESDPSSITSESYRKLAAEYAPELKAKLGPKFDTMTAQQLKGVLPALEKQYQKKIEITAKEQERKDKAAENDKDRQAKIQAARIKAAGKGNTGPAAPKIGEVQKGLTTITKLEEEQANLNQTERLLAEATELVGKVETGPITGRFFDTAVGKAFAGPDRQRLTQIRDELTVQVQALQKGAASDADARRYQDVVDMLNKDDPGPGIKAALEAVKERQAVIGRSIADQAQLIKRQPTPVKPTVSGW